MCDLGTRAASQGGRDRGDRILCRAGSVFVRAVRAAHQRGGASSIADGTTIFCTALMAARRDFPRTWESYFNVSLLKGSYKISQIAQLAECNARSSGVDDTIFAGIRVVFTAWIVHQHVVNELPCFTIDMNQYIAAMFCILAGLSLKMQDFSGTFRDSVQRVAPLYPITWSTLLVHHFITGARLDIADFTLLGYLWMNSSGLVQAWYLSAHLLFVACYKPLDHLLSRGIACGRKRLYAGTITLCVVRVFAINTVVGHIWSPMRIPGFFLGMVLATEMTEQTQMISFQTDAFMCAWAMCVVMNWTKPHAWFFALADPIFAVILVFLCNSPTSYSAKFLSSKVMHVLARFTLTVYIIHNTVKAGVIDVTRPLVGNVLHHTECSSPNWTVMYCTVQGASWLLSVPITHYVQEPAQRAINAFLAGGHGAMNVL